MNARPPEQYYEYFTPNAARQATEEETFEYHEELRLFVMYRNGIIYTLKKGQNIPLWKDSVGHARAGE